MCLDENILLHGPQFSHTERRQLEDLEGHSSRQICVNALGPGATRSQKGCSWRTSAHENATVQDDRPGRCT
jgi:hypothetical protein